MRETVTRWPSVRDAMARIGLLLMAALVTPAALAAQAARADAGPAPPVPVVPHGFLGYTFCRNGLAESWVRADIVGTAQAEEVLAHEAVHRAQAAAYPDCEAWQASMVSARRVIEMEIPAYCAQYRILVGRGADPDSLRLEYALRIAAQAGAIENRLDVRGMFRAQCGLVPASSPSAPAPAPPAAAPCPLPTPPRAAAPVPGCAPSAAPPPS
jgi:hypothetical protein